MQMTRRYTQFLAVVAISAFVLSGCAQSSTVDSLRNDVNAANQLARDANAKAESVQKSAEMAAAAAQQAAKRAEEAAEAAKRAAEQADRAYRATLKK